MARQVWPNIVNRDVAQPSRVQLTQAEGVTDANVYDVLPIPGTIKAEGTKINKTLFDQMEQYIKEYDVPIHTTTGTGAAYAVSVPVWSNLTQTELDGRILCIIPNVVSTTVSPTLNMNGLGAKPIYALGDVSTSDRGNLPNASYLTANVPVYLIYNKSGDCWITMNTTTTPGGASGIGVLDAWPVGSVFVAKGSAKNPAALFGGTWTLITTTHLFIGLWLYYRVA